jgi:hypothetical protein
LFAFSRIAVATGVTTAPHLQHSLFIDPDVPF